MVMIMQIYYMCIVYEEKHLIFEIYFGVVSCTILLVCLG